MLRLSPKSCDLTNLLVTFQSRFDKISAKLKNVKGKVRLHGVAYISSYMFEFRTDSFQKNFEKIRKISEEV